jgi:hypothetical protein
MQEFFTNWWPLFIPVIFGLFAKRDYLGTVWVAAVLVFIGYMRTHGWDQGVNEGVIQGNPHADANLQTAVLYVSWVFLGLAATVLYFIPVFFRWALGWYPQDH